MAFRRYGGDVDSKGAGSNLKVSIIGVYLLVGCSVLTLLTGELGFFLLGFIFLFAFMVVGMFYRGSENTGEQRQLHHIENAERYFEEGNIKELSESIRKARIYGELPKKYSYLEKEIERNA